MSSHLRTDLPFGPGNTAVTRRNETRPRDLMREVMADDPACGTLGPEHWGDTDHHERAKLIIDEAAGTGLDPVKALRAAAGVARELGRPEQAEAFEAEAARFVELPLDFSGGAPSGEAA